MSGTRALIGEALQDLIAAAQGQGPVLRIGLMAVGSEMGSEAPVLAAQAAMAADSRLRVVCIGPKPARPAGAAAAMEWLETPEGEKAVVAAMEEALRGRRLAGAVALHYPFPPGVTTVGRAFTPAAGRPLLLASSTGRSAADRAQSMLHNAILGLAVAKALGQADPSLGILNLDGAATVLRAVLRLRDKGYPVRLGASVRADGGALLRGNDLLAGSVDVCVCDTLTGNVLMKLLGAAQSGGGCETLGWGYGPSVGKGWPFVVSIVSRASGVPVIANALACTAAAVRGNIQAKVAEEYSLAEQCGLAAELASLAPERKTEGSPPAPAGEPVDAELYGVDVLDMDAAIRLLWKAGIYAESAMGCTGPVVRVAAANKARAEHALRAARFL